MNGQRRPSLNRRSSSASSEGYVPARRSPLRNVTSFDSPLVEAGEYEEDASQEKSDFLTQILPDPTKPRASQRATATTVIFLFISCVVWLAAIDSSPDEYSKGIAWAYLRTYSAGAALSTQNAWSVDRVQSFSKEQVDAVTQQAVDGALNSYEWHGTVTDWNERDQGRLVVLGDIHGMNDSVVDLLDRLALGENDVLVHVGDLVAKSPVAQSKDTVTLMRMLGAQGVRGNHDQGVIQWREWMEAMGALAAMPVDAPLQTGMTTRRVRKRTARLQARLPQEGANAAGSGRFGQGEQQIGEAVPSVHVNDRQDDDVPSSADSDSEDDDAPADEAAASEADEEDMSNGSLTGPQWAWLDLPAESLDRIGVAVPKGWEWQGEWFHIARSLSSDDFDYLKSLPLTLRLDSLRTYIVHAGMLPWRDEPKTQFDEGQHSQSLLTSTQATTFAPASGSQLTSPDLAILTEEPNTRADTLLTMRTVKNSGEPSSNGKKGTPWFEIWNEHMSAASKDGLNMSVLYGHWAGKGLTVKDYSIGLDSGCVYGRSLSALVMPMNPSADIVSPLSDPSRASVSGWQPSVIPADVPGRRRRWPSLRRRQNSAGEPSCSEQGVTFAGRNAHIVSMTCSRA